MNLFNGMFGKVKNGMCRLSMDGKIAISTSNGYKTYDMKNNRLTNCDSFVFDIGEEMFFVIPTNDIKEGDIILASGSPVCVTKMNEDDTITAVKYEDGTVLTMLPERHMFMGSTYFYGKIMSLFGTNLMNGKKGMDKMMSYMMIKEMMRGFNGTGSSDMSALLPMMMLSNGNFSNMFEGMFDFGTEDEDEEEEVEEVKTKTRKRKIPVALEAEEE